MKTLKIKKENKLSLSVFGENQNSDWNILWKIMLSVLILAVIGGFYFYFHITREIGRDAEFFSANKAPINTEKADKIISDFEIRKNNFENFQLK